MVPSYTHLRASPGRSAQADLVLEGLAPEGFLVCHIFQDFHYIPDKGNTARVFNFIYYYSACIHTCVRACQLRTVVRGQFCDMLCVPFRELLAPCECLSHGAVSPPCALFSKFLIVFSDLHWEGAECSEPPGLSGVSECSLQQGLHPTCSHG